MGRSREYCEARLDDAIRILFQADPDVHAVGVTPLTHGFGFIAIKSAEGIHPISTPLANPSPIPASLLGVPVIVDEVDGDVRPLARTFAVPEPSSRRSLVCGIGIQNGDANDRRRKASEETAFGTLGGFVTTTDGSRRALLSNAHVLAAGNQGQIGDRILRSGSPEFTPENRIATLLDWIPLRSGVDAPTQQDDWNVVDAALALLDEDVDGLPQFDPALGFAFRGGVAAARKGQNVYKVGHTTQLRSGRYDGITPVVARIKYPNLGTCWFKDQMAVKHDSARFAEPGDSGSLVLVKSGGVVGLLFAVDAKYAYVNPIEVVLERLNCSLV